MLLTCALLFAAPSIAPVHPLQQEERRGLVRQQYEALSEKRDADGLAKLWTANQDLILQTIDADLEGGLAEWEKSPQDPDDARIEALYGRALFGATAASRATGSPIFADYASSFVGWNEEQKRNFRAGQALYKRALDEIQAEEYDAAIAAAQDSRERAVSLGDWWGVAMGTSAEARALQAGGHLDEALAAYGTARLLYHELGLARSEYQNLRALADLSRALDRFPRAHAALEQALELARRLELKDDRADLLRARAGVERALGRDEDAAASEAEADAHGGGK